MKFDLTADEIAKNQKNIKKHVDSENWDGLYISSFDPYLSEYVPQISNHRYYITGFTGSVAEVLVTSSEIRLYVDGRYFEQADQEVDLNMVAVVKCKSSISAALMSDIQNLKLKKLAYEKERTPVSYLEKFEKITEAWGLEPGNLSSILNYHNFKTANAIESLDGEPYMDSTEEKLQRVFSDNPGDAYFVTALDSVSWITNGRGYHLPHLSSFMGKALVSIDKIWVFVEPGIAISGEFSPKVEFIHCAQTELAAELKKVDWKFDRVFYDSKALTSFDFELLRACVEPLKLRDSKGLIPFHSIKTEKELEIIRENFSKSNKAIFNTIKWFQGKYADGETIHEKQLNNATTRFYEEQGSKDQSFSTISGIGANSSIIHYGNPSEEVFANEDDVVLLDSGGYFRGGFATDTTRTFKAHRNGVPDPKWKEIYTLVLKGVFQVEMAVFPSGTEGKVIDGLARAPMMKYGYNFAHGTGHGVGIHVHEDGTRISPVSNYQMKAGQVVSIEPGIYIPGFGGVRIENIAIVKQHKEFEGFLCFEQLVYIDFEWGLIDESLLTFEEKDYLNKYREKCQELGTAFA